MVMVAHPDRSVIFVSTYPWIYGLSMDMWIYEYTSRGHKADFLEGSGRTEPAQEKGMLQFACECSRSKQPEDD